MKNPPPSHFLLDMYQACQLITELSHVPFEKFQDDMIQVSAMSIQCSGGSGQTFTGT